MPRMRELFNYLSASGKMEFLEWAADSVGARVEHGFATSATPAAEPEEIDLDRDMPPILRRGKKPAKKKGREKK